MGEDAVNGLFIIASFNILAGFFNAQVNPNEPTRNPYSKCKSIMEVPKTKDKDNIYRCIGFVRLHSDLNY